MQKEVRKKIQDLAYARFYSEKPLMAAPVESVEFDVFPGDVYRGSFVLRSENGVPLHGTACSSHSRISCLTPEFSGVECSLVFEFLSRGLRAGEICKGAITVVSDGGECSVGFLARIVPRFLLSSVGNIGDLGDFARLAQSSWEEAYRIYTAESFKGVLEQATERERLLYRALGGAEASMAGMEEFLVGVGRKERAAFSLGERKLAFAKALEDDREILEVHRDGWGYLDIAVTSDNEAFVPVKGRITSASLVGNHGTVEFVIRRDRLHAGNNFGRIILESIHQRECCEICVYDGEKGRSGIQRSEDRTTAVGLPSAYIGRSPALEKRQLLARLARLYLDFRMRRLVTGVWATESCGCLERLREMEPQNQWFVLYQAQALLVNKQRQEADWLLAGFGREKVQKDSPLYAYYLYLMTLREQEPSCVSKAFRQIQEIYHRNQENLWLSLMMLFLDPQLARSRSRKLSAIREKVAEGMHSPILYLEAYELFRKDVYLLQKADDFALQVLSWAAKEHTLDPGVARQIVKCMPQVRSFHPLWYGILQECYRVEPQTETLAAIVSYCIRWNVTTPKQFLWFQLGIQEELNIAGLYEAWMDSADAAQIAEFPRPVMIYFQYQNSMDQRKRALLYASIVKSRHRQGGLYGAYQKKIEQFALDQLFAGNIDENLAVIYREVLGRMTIDEKTADKLSKVLYTCKVTAADRSVMRLVAVQQELTQEEAALPVNGEAYLPICSGNYWIVAEDERGVRYLPKEGCLQIQRLLKPEDYIEACVGAAENDLRHLIFYYTVSDRGFCPEDEKRLLYLMGSPEVTKAFKDQWRPAVIDHYAQAPDGGGVQDFLRLMDWDGLNGKSREQLMELFTVCGSHDRAFSMMADLGCEQVSVSRMLLVAGEKLAEPEAAEEEWLLWLCTAIFNRGIYNEAVLAYLLRYFQGSLGEQERLWRAAREFDLDTYALEERFLSQLLYAEGWTEDAEEIFWSYFQAKGREMLLLAFLSYASYRYFVKELPVKDLVFACIARQIAMENPLNDCCRLACLKWLTGREERSKEQEELLEQLLREYLGRGKTFAFYQRLPEGLKRSYHLGDRVFLEQRAAPFGQVTLRYCIRGTSEQAEWRQTSMDEMYEGIFGKELVLFYGEEASYSIWEGQEALKMMEPVKTGTVSWRDIAGIQAGELRSRFGLINAMLICRQNRDEQALSRLRSAYERMERGAEEQFELL